MTTNINPNSFEDFASKYPSLASVFIDECWSVTTYAQNSIVRFGFDSLGLAAIHFDGVLTFRHDDTIICTIEFVDPHSDRIAVAILQSLIEGDLF
jgi:hypothetical protein